MNQEKLSANIWKLYLIKGLRSFMLAIPIIVLFFQENGLSMQQVFLLQALFPLRSSVWKCRPDIFRIFLAGKNPSSLGEFWRPRDLPFIPKLTLFGDFSWRR